MNNKKIVVTGGGSGGHISAASAIIEGVNKNLNIPNENILYIGGDLGMVNEKPGNSLEQKRFKDTPFKTKFIRAGKLQRRLQKGTLRLLFRTLLGLKDAYKELKIFKPDLIFSTGGFVSVPVCISGYLMKIPIYIHEQTAAVGLSNRLVGKFAKKIFVTYPQSSKYFPQEKVIHVGNVVRQSVFEKNFNEEIKNTIEKMKDNKLPVIYISGGGLGSHLVNNLIYESLDTLLEKYNLIIQTGDNSQYNDFEKYIEKRNTLSNELQERIYPTKFIDSEYIGYIYSNIDVFVGRSGANTVYEIGCLEIPSIFIPIPWVQNNEQEKNANILKNLGLSKVIKEEELTVDILIQNIKEILSKPQSLNSEKLKEVFKRDAVDNILEHLKNENI